MRFSRAKKCAKLLTIREQNSFFFGYWFLIDNLYAKLFIKFRGIIV